MITAASDQRAYDALQDSLSDEPREDICPMCGIDCRCDGPHWSITDALISAAKSASSLRTLTPSFGRTDADDTVVVDEPVKVARHIPADPRLSAAADDIAESILAVLKAHGYTVVRKADTQHHDEQRQREFARECGRNAMAVIAMTEAA